MDEDEGFAVSLTTAGLQHALDIHYKLSDGESLEYVAAFYNHTVEEVRIILAVFYATIEHLGIDLEEIPDTVDDALRGLDD